MLAMENPRVRMENPQVVSNFLVVMTLVSKVYGWHVVFYEFDGVLYNAVNIDNNFYRFGGVLIREKWRMSKLASVC